MKKNTHGYLTMLAVFLIVVIGFLGLSIVRLFVSGANSNLNAHQREAAYFIANAGAEEATRYVLSKGVSCASISGHSDLTSISFGSGVFTVTASYYNLSTTLSSAMTASDTTISAVNTSGFSSSGVLVIDSEALSYAGISGNTFTGVGRGLFGTTAAAHASAASVTQRECFLTSSAHVPNASSPYASVTLTKAVQLPLALGSGWAVGAPANSKFTFVKWNSSTSWSDNPVTPSGTAMALNGVSLISATNGWAVGASGTLLQWDGSNWNYIFVPAASVDQSGVSCPSSTNCHSAGDRKGNDPGLLDWDGTTWTRPIGGSGTWQKSNLRGMHCSSTNNCWAVGDNTSSGVFYNWNGSGWTGTTLAGLSAYTYNGVFCNSSSDCWAVGANATFARYNGSSWSDYATGLTATIYRGIYCNSSSDCWAVGDSSSSQTRIARWNGTSWSNYSPPSPNSNLKGVSCSASNLCWAVGSVVSSGDPVFFYWDGTSWVNVSVSGLASNTSLNAVSIIPSTSSFLPSNSAVIQQSVS